MSSENNSNSNNNNSDAMLNGLPRGLSDEVYLLCDWPDISPILDYLGKSRWCVDRNPEGESAGWVQCEYESPHQIGGVPCDEGITPVLLVDTRMRKPVARYGLLSHIARIEGVHVTTLVDKIMEQVVDDQCGGWLTRAVRLSCDSLMEAMNILYAEGICLGDVWDKRRVPNSTRMIQVRWQPSITDGNPIRTGRLSLSVDGMSENTTVSAVLYVEHGEFVQVPQYSFAELSRFSGVLDAGICREWCMDMQDPKGWKDSEAPQSRQVQRIITQTCVRLYEANK